MSFKHIFTLIVGLIFTIVVFIGGFFAGGGFATDAAEQTYKQTMVEANETCFPAADWDTLRQCVRAQNPGEQWEWLDQVGQ